MLRKYVFLSFCLLFSLSTLKAQVFEYGNDWYKNNPSQNYIKLIVSEDGIYRASLQDFQQAGFDLSGVNPDFLRLIYRGKEVNMYVKKSGSTLQYIEFFGLRNNGAIDSIMYRDPITGTHKPDLQPNKTFSIFSDESAYFLTWNNVPSANRIFSNLDPTFQLYTPEPHFRYEARSEYHPDSSDTEYVFGGGGQFDSFYTLNSDYVSGEGYLGPSFSFGDPYTVKVQTPAPANAGDSVDISMRVFGRSNTQHIFRAELNGESSTPIIDTTIGTSSIYIKTYRRKYKPTFFLGDETDITYQALRANTDNNQIAMTSIVYDRLPDLDGDSAILIKDFSKTGKGYFRFTNLNGSDTLYVYDLKNKFRNVGLITLGVGQVLIQPFNNSRDLFVSTDKGIRTPKIMGSSLAELHKVDAGAEYVIIANPMLSSSAEAYANYRDTATVSPVSSVKVVYTDQIYDEYGYGTITPWAIKRFCKDALDNWDTKPKYFLLWGKGRNRARDIGNTPIVPTYGFPATDYEFVSHFDQNSFEINPEAAIGRLNLFSNEEGMNYLNKVNTYEHSTWNPWMKKATFLGGGGTLGEQNAISDAFQFMMNIYEGIPFGGEVIYYQKRSGDIEIDPTTASYHDEISNGVGIIHFFGHSTSNILDVSIKEPHEYNNVNRFPIMIAMGCYGGDFTVSNASFGERWVSQPDRGSIAYLGNSSAGYLNPLKDYGKIVYGFSHDSSLGKPMGIVLQNSLASYTESLSGIQYRNHGRQMNLQGDPAIILYHPEQPDLSVQASDVFFEPDNFTAQDDSFKINIIVTNQGLVENPVISTTIKQRLPDNTIFEHPAIIRSVFKFKDTLTLTLNNPAGNLMTGQNVFEIFVDAENQINEYNEDNNRVNVSRVVPGNIPAILYPVEYAIVGENQISLQASAFFMTQDENVGFVFEIDTSATFDSPLKTESGVVQGKSTFAEWPLPFTLIDSAVYFWRVRLDNVKPSVWSTASFKYIANRKGWAQAEINQFSKDVSDKVSLDLLQKEWKFNTFAKQYEFTTRQGGGFAFFLNNNLITDLLLNDYNANGIAFVVLDQYTLEPDISTAEIGNLGVARSPDQLYRLKNAILNAKAGDYIIVGSHKNPQVPLWEQDLFDALKLIGVSDNIKTLKDGDAFMLMGRKSYPIGSATEIYKSSSENKYVLNTILYGYNTEGEVNSTRIGPALDWESLFWGWESQDLVNRDKAEVQVFGIRADETEKLLFQQLPEGDYDLTQIDAKEFPYLRLAALKEDTVNRTAPQLDNWHVLFSPAPDAVIDPITNFSFESDTIYEGQDVYIRLGARNISDIPFDSMDVRFTLERSDRTRLVLDSIRIAPLTANGPVVEFEYTFNSLNKNLDGDINLLVELNPTREYAESHYFNNLYVQPFKVIVDNLNPIMDVTFDGKHIIDGDIVSPTPEILVEVNDENSFIALDDTSNFEIYFKEGTINNTSFPRIYLDDPRVEWVPATLPENKAQLYFYPGRGVEGPLQDQEYTLRVQGKDNKGNPAGRGNNYYEISFKVENESSITQILNYPNPFSSSTRFVYTLAGAELPEVFQIHIYTISGKQVKVIDLVEMGDVSLGRNITEYAWDGTDDYGDKLANGVYLYKTIIEMPSQDLKHRDEGIDQYFNKGWGKMYILR